jgi:hypothetical protein
MIGELSWSLNRSASSRLNARSFAGISARGRQHLELQAGAFLEEARRHRCGPNVRRDRRDAVPSHHHGDAVAQRFGKRVAERTRPDEPDAVVLGDTIDECGALVMNDPVRLADLRQAHTRGRMRVDDGIDARTHCVDTRMNPQLAVWCATARKHVAVGVEHEQLVFVRESRRASRRKQECLRPRNARADVAERIRQAEPFDDPVRDGDVAAQRLKIFHVCGAGLTSACAKRIRTRRLLTGRGRISRESVYAGRHASAQIPRPSHRCQSGASHGTATPFRAIDPLKFRGFAMRPTTGAAARVPPARRRPSAAG